MKSPSPASSSRRSSVRPDKIRGRHLERQALVYVRQSSLHQVVRHQESTRLQYGLVERAVQLGWSRKRVLVIDDDLGCSGTSVEGRPGFQRLVAEVSLDQVGIVLGLEMSRLARSCRDWHQLLEVCAVFGTLIGDLDGVYDPRVFNDRLLLGLKGTMSEAELHVIKQRMYEGKLAKARRGELEMRLPMGYVRRPSGEVVKDPDEEARATIGAVFAAFERVGTLHGLLRHLVETEVRMPCRFHTGPRKGELDWRRPNSATLANLLHNPTYAGAYVFGRRRSNPRKRLPGRPSTGFEVVAPEDWEVVLKNRLPAYITWEQFDRNLRRLSSNRSQSRGVARQGQALLAGLVRCGRCGRRMTVHYANRKEGKYLSMRYVCNQAYRMRAERPCQSLVGVALDRVVAETVLEALEPAALELSLKVAENLEDERRQRHQQWQRRLERARYDAERAARQYHAVEPENRLVARTLESAWEDALLSEAALAEEYARFRANEPKTLTVDERAAIRQLASDIPALWSAPTTTDGDRQAIIREVVDQVVVLAQGTTERMEASIHWQGGQQTTVTFERPIRRWDQRSDYAALVARLTELWAESAEFAEVARQLNAEGWGPSPRGAVISAEMVRELLARHDCPDRPPHAVSGWRQRQLDGEWTLQELASHLDIPRGTLYRWLRNGRIEGRKAEGAPWIVRADEAECCYLRETYARARERQPGDGMPPVQRASG